MQGLDGCRGLKIMRAFEHGGGLVGVNNNTLDGVWLIGEQPIIMRQTRVSNLINFLTGSFC